MLGPLERNEAVLTAADRVEGGFRIGSLSGMPLSAIKPLQIPTMGLEIMSNERVRVAYIQ